VRWCPDLDAISRVAYALFLRPSRRGLRRLCRQGSSRVTDGAGTARDLTGLVPVGVPHCDDRHDMVISVVASATHGWHVTPGALFALAAAIAVLADHPWARLRTRLALRAAVSARHTAARAPLAAVAAAAASSCCCNSMPWARLQGSPVDCVGVRGAVVIGGAVEVGAVPGAVRAGRAAERGAVGYPHRSRRRTSTGVRSAPASRSPRARRRSRRVPMPAVSTSAEPESGSTRQNRSPFMSGSFRSTA